MKAAWMLALAMAATVPVALAQPPQRGFEAGGHRAPMERDLGSHGHAGRWWNDPHVIERLKLTDDQRKAMDQILLDHRLQLIDLRGNVEKAELALEPLMHDDQPNETKILAQIDKLAQARAELEKGNARFLLALRAKLQPEQWKQLQALRTERRGFAGGDEQRGPGFRGFGEGQRGPGFHGPAPQAPPPPAAPGCAHSELTPVRPQGPADV